MKLRVTFLTIAFALAVAIGQVQAADTKSIDVPAGDLATALETLAKDLARQLAFTSESPIL